MQLLEVITKKIQSLDSLKKQLEIWRIHSDRIVFTNGCFDILHRGHLEYLAAAADLGNRLVIGLNSDESVSRLKGPNRPINCFSDRALALASLHVCDAVIEFKEDTPEQLIHAISPDVLVKGGDYTEEEIVGSHFVRSYGGEIAIIDFTAGYSTTRFLERIKK